MSHSAILCDFDRAEAALRARGEAAREALAACLHADPALKLHSVSLRLKARPSLAGKLARPERTYGRLWEVTDLVGLRVITYFEDGVEHAGRLIEARLPVDFRKSIDKRRGRDASGFGYRSLHYVCRFPAGTPELPEEARYEIQVRTILEHAWAEIEHDLGYKSRDAVPVAARRRLSRLAGLLELADQEFVAIRRELHDYAASLPRRIAEAAEAVPLDQLSVVSLLEDPEARAVDEAIAAAAGKPLGDDPFYPEYLLRMLGAAGVRTAAEARAGLLRHREVIPAMVRPYFAFTAEAFRLSPETMERLPRGYSLFFLAHLAVLGSPALGVNKVERLAHLYRELDYPQDAEAALRVASDLVHAFRELA
jgi:ppGpp synthetase/RelA/SpoT-type nucleotidyltranferase